MALPQRQTPPPQTTPRKTTPRKTTPRMATQRKTSRRARAIDPAGYSYNELLPLTRTCLEADLAVLVLGHPGVGKSTLAAELARDMKLPMEDIRLAQREPAELGGVYFPSLDRSELSLLPPPWVRRACAQPTFIFLDEINAAVTRLHQAAAYQIVLERRVGAFRFHPGTVIMAAGNLAEDHAIVTPLSSALSNRFAHFTLRVDAHDWLAWAESRDLAPQVVAYMRSNIEMASDLLYNNNGDDAFPTPRSWAMVAAVLDRDQPALAKRLVAACIGPSAAQRFFSFMRLYDRFQPDKVIEQGQAVDFREGELSEASFAFAAITAVARFAKLRETRWRPEWDAHLVRFLRSPGLDAEYAFLLLRDLHAKTGLTERLKQSADYRALANEIVTMHAAAFA